MHAAFFLASLCLAADPYSAIAAGKPAIPAPLTSLTRGMKEKALLTALKVSERDECMILGVRAGSLCVVPFWDERDGYLRPAILFTSLSATRAALRQRWGEPIVYERSWYWVNPETKLRARLRDTDNPAQLDFESYVPLQDFLGDGPKLAFEHTPILGSTRAVIEKAYGVKCDNDEYCAVFFPPCEVDSTLLVQIELSGKVATKLLVDLPTRDEARKELTFKLLEKKWGRRRLVEGEKKDWNFERRPDVLLYQLAGDLTVRITR